MPPKRSLYSAGEYGRSKRARSSRSGALRSYGSNRYSSRNSRYSRSAWPYQTPSSYKYAWDPFPAIAKVRMRYAQNITLASTAGVPASHLFRCNSIFDPDYTGAGHQPYGHDTYQSIYNHYRVTKATITVANCIGFNGVLGCTITDDTTVETDYDTIKERKSTNLAPIVSGNGSNAQVSNVWTGDITGAAIAKNIALFGAGPPDPMYFHVWAEGSNSATGDTAQCLVTIVYDCVLSELKDLGQS